MGGYSVPLLLQRCVSIVLLPVYTHYLRPKDYGILDLLDLFGNIVGALIGIRLGQGIFYFYFHAENDQERSRYVTTSLIGAAILGVAAAAVIFPASTAFSSLVLGDASYGYLFRIFVIGFMLSLPLEFGFCYLRVKDRSKAYTVMATARLVASVILNVVFLAVFHLGAASILWTNVVVNTALMAAMTMLILAENPLSFGRRHFVELVRYTVPLGVTSLGELGLHFGDRIFLRPNVTLSLLGIYSLGYKIGMLVSYASSPFFTYWNAQMVGLVRAPNGEHLYERMATYLFLGLSYLALLVTVFAHPALTIAAAPDYRPAAALIPWIALAYVIRGMGSYFLNTFLLEKRPADVARITWIGTGVCMGGYALLIPRFKLWGAVAATLAGFTTILVIGLWKSQRVRRFRYEYSRWLKLIIAAAVVLVPFEILRPATFWPQVAAGIAAASLFPAVLLLLGFLTQDERRVFKNGWAMAAGRGA